MNYAFPFQFEMMGNNGSPLLPSRSLGLGSVAEKRGRSIHISDLEELLSGCTQLEVRN